MEIKEILTLLQAVSESKLTSFTYEEGETKLSFTIDQTTNQTEKRTELPISPISKQDKITEDTMEYITSPMVGTFYTASSEDAKPYIEAGDVIKKGQVIGIVEAMKLMNEIESPYDGVVVEVLVDNRDMVGFEQPLVKVQVK